MHNEITKLLVNICKMQKEAVREEIQEEMCDGKLGKCAELGRAKFNTRPLEIYTDDDKAWSCPVDRENPCCKSEGDKRTCILRVEKVVDGCATFRALKHHSNECVEGHREGHGHERFKSTDSFITIKLENIAAIRCLKDCFVNLCIR